VLRVCDAADRAIDDQVSRSSGGAPPKKLRLSPNRQPVGSLLRGLLKVRSERISLLGSGIRLLINGFSLRSRLRIAYSTRRSAV
jgi:hypothetical protein